MSDAYGWKWARHAVVACLLALPVTSCDFVSPTESDPNVVPDATLDQLFTGIQVNSYFFNEGNVARMAVLFTQQIAGTDRQFADYDNYAINEEIADGEMAAIYTGGGLIDMLEAISQAEAEGRNAYAGVIKVHMAWMFGMAASVWGDLPFSQAADPEIAEPALDDQSAVYAAVQSLLDQAISDLSGAGPPGGVDLNFQGDTGAWIRVARSLKARFHMHMAEVEGSSRYQSALAEAQQGINDVSGNWLGIHGASSTENNFWFQFYRDRDSYTRVGAVIVNLMLDRDDPRLPLYFTEGSGDFAGQFVGSPPGSPAGDPGTNASFPNVPIQPDFDQPIITCAETQFIAAEASFRLGDEAGARSFLNAGIACQEANWGVDIADPGALAGQALLEEIMVQKYIANFLNIEVWNDWKRACIPQLIAHPNGQPVPLRLYYGQNERQTNSNIPAPNTAGNDLGPNPNDPNPC